ncbi:MAG: hypothetical protein OXQ89_00115 [Rhodospirillaceae bacterium]|nr:hypothetical protein [Rhodospirillaceae bacterium]MDD9996124.1 hypothetical protein [Rhodospirillaceae bacterium]MDE0361492.1 hypothetical protein [Rhodospirillaceae bacterium]
MAATAFDTLDAARRLKAAGIEAEHAEAIVEIMGQSVNQLVTREHFSKELGLTREHFDAKLRRTREHFDAKLRRTREHFDAELRRTREHFDAELQRTREHFDAEIAKLRAEFMHTHLISVGVLIAAIALATTILGMMMTRGGGI